MNPRPKEAIIDGKIYNTETALLLCGNDWWDGNNYERGGTQKFLYRTNRGAYFTLNLTQWEGSRDTIIAVEDKEAIAFYGLCAQRKCVRVDFGTAFPGVKLEEA